MAKTWAVVPAAGRGLRMGGDKPKQFLELSGRPILWHTLRALLRAPFLSGIFLAVPEDCFGEAQKVLESLPGRSAGNARPIRLVAGGTERRGSVLNALERLPADCEWVLIHDGVRPLVSALLIEQTWKAALLSGAAIAALPATDTVKRVREQKVAETLLRDEIWLVQTPQVFKKDIVVEAYRRAAQGDWPGTDDASFVERLGAPVSVVPGDRFNIKVTTAQDLDWAESYLKSKPQ